MPEDEPELSEIARGVANRLTLMDVVVALLLALAGTAYALYKGSDIWWIYPIVLGGIVFVLEAVQWYYFDYRQNRLQEKAERLAGGEDVDPQLDTGPGVTSPFTLSLLGSIVAWYLISMYLLRPAIGRYPATYAFLGGILPIILGVGLLFNMTGKMD